MINWYEKRWIKTGFWTKIPNPIIWGYVYKKTSPEMFEKIKDISKDYHYSRFANKQLYKKVVFLFIVIVLVIAIPLLYIWYFL